MSRLACRFGRHDCDTSGTRSYSRVFGPRFEEAKATA